jgi:hypothetical protein
LIRRRGRVVVGSIASDNESKYKIKAVSRTQIKRIARCWQKKSKWERNSKAVRKPKTETQTERCKNHTLLTFTVCKRAIKVSSQLPGSYRLLKSWRNKPTQIQSFGPSANSGNRSMPDLLFFVCLSTALLVYVVFCFCVFPLI